MDQTPDWIKVLVIGTLFGGGLWLYLSLEKKAKASAAAATAQRQASPHIPRENDVPPILEKKKTWIQEILALPGIGQWVATFLGLILPFVVSALLLPDCPDCYLVFFLLPNGSSV